MNRGDALLARRYRQNAQEVRAIAALDEYDPTRSALLVVANSYEMMAACLEFRAIRPETV